MTLTLPTAARTARSTALDHLADAMDRLRHDQIGEALNFIDKARLVLEIEEQFREAKRGMA